jgi:hypothetical protein
MTDEPEPPGDLQRPLDESAPTETTTPRSAPGVTPAPEVTYATGVARPTDVTTTGDPATSAATPGTSGDPVTNAATSGMPDDPATSAATSGTSGDPVTDATAAEPTVPLRPAVPGAPAGPPADVGDAPLALVARHRRLGVLLRTAGAVRDLSSRSGRAALAWTRRPSGRLVMPGVLTAALVAVAGWTGAFVIPTAGVPTASTPPAVPTGAPTVPGGATAPPVPAPPVVGTGTPAPEGNPAQALATWAEDMSVRTDIPVVALQAYGYAELVMGSTMPGCQLRWTTLAAIGRVESNHGSSGDSTLLPDGRALPAIIGLPLDGQGGRQHIADTDGGELDGDTVYDRAVGPMQFIPQTWYAEASPLRGISDIHNINDASLAAAHYLCRNGRDLSVAEDWWGAILSYNNVQAYAQAVFDAANQYGQLSRGG